MKSKLSALAVILAMAGIAGLHDFNRVRATQPKPRREVVILQGYQISTESGSGLHYKDIGVICSSSSAGAPVFPGPVFSNGITPPMVPLAEAMAQLMSLGFRIDKIDGHLVHLSN